MITEALKRLQLLLGPKGIVDALSDKANSGHKCQTREKICSGRCLYFLCISLKNFQKT